MSRSPNKRSRRGGTWGATSVVTLLALVLVGCGGGDDRGNEGSGSKGDASNISGAPNDGAFPVTIEHRFGSTTIDAEPTRVVTVGLTDQDPTIALGVVPVGTAEWFGQQPGALWPWAADLVGDAPLPEVIKGADGISYEKLAALRPDLILSVYGGLTQDEYDKLRQIAPTVAQPDDHIDWGVPWQEQTEIIGKALGRSDEADALVADVEGQIADARAAHPELDGATGVMATISGDQVAIYGPSDPRGRLMAALGLVAPPEVATLAGDSFSADVSKERIDLIDGDLVAWIINDKATDVPKFEAEPLYAELPVHTEGRDVFLEMLQPEGAAATFISVLSIPYVLDEVVPQFAAAVDGDPSTR